MHKGKDHVSTPQEGEHLQAQKASEETELADTLVKTVRNKFLLCRLPSLCFLVMTALTSKYKEF